jgi:hypothetical protein
MARIRFANQIEGENYVLCGSSNKKRLKNIKSNNYINKLK